jgi:drug/metabolite transporter (DMT)-like permease
MTGVAVLLVVVSAFAHASWNLIAKRSTTPELANWWMATSGSAIMLPAAIVLLILDAPPAIGWVFIASTIGLHIMYFFTLGRAYRYGDLSIVYPVARGLGLTLIPILGITLLGERMSVVAGLGAAFILVGIITVSVNAHSPEGTRRPITTILRDKGVLFALATGVLIGSYSVLDKRGVSHVTPVLYMFFLTTGGSLGSLVLIHRHYSRRQFVAEVQMHWKPIVVGGLLQFLAYVLVLSALRLSSVSYVGPFRELAIGIGVILGALVLKERVTRGRALGAASVVLGALTIALAP